MMNPWVILGIALAWVASLWAFGNWREGVGVTAEKAKWQSREIAQQAASAAKIRELQDAARETEARRVQEMTTLATSYAKGFRDAEDQRRRDVAAARDGALVLRVPAAACGTGAGGAGAFGPPAPGGDGPATTELPRAVTEDLLALANEADEVVRQLTACQSIILSDRRISP